MKFTLRKNGYSAAERELFSLLPRHPKTVNAFDLSSKPLESLSAVSVGATLRSLARKVEANQEGFRVAHSRRSGPNHLSWWLEASR